MYISLGWVDESLSQMVPCVLLGTRAPFGFTIRNRPGCHLGLIFYKEVRNVLHVLIWIDPSVPNQQSCVCLFRNQSIDYSLLLNTWTRLNTSISFWHHFLFLGEKINNYCCDVLGGGSTPCGYWLFYWTQQNSGSRCNVLFICFFLFYLAPVNMWRVWMAYYNWVFWNGFIYQLLDVK